MPKGTKKPKTAPPSPFPSEPDTLHREGNWLWIPLRSEWRDVTAKPEEIVRQTFIRHLVDHYGYPLDSEVASPAIAPEDGPVSVSANG